MNPSAPGDMAKSQKKPDYLKILALAKTYTPQPQLDRWGQALFGFVATNAALGFFCEVAGIEYGEQLISWLMISSIGGGAGYLRGKGQENAFRRAMERAEEELMVNHDRS